MTAQHTTVDPSEVDKFAQHASEWWNTEGPLKTLHDINATRIDFIKQYCVLKGLRVLDVGCGGGILSEGMAQAGAHVTGLDATHEAIAVAQKHASLSDLTIDYHACPIEDFEASKPFDVIVCMELLEHVSHPELILEHCARLLKPEGILFLSTINRTLKAYLNVIVAAEYILGLLPKQTHEYQKFIKPSELRAAASHVGLELIDIQGLQYNPLSRKACLTQDSSMNFLMAFKIS